MLSESNPRPDEKVLSTVESLLLVAGGPASLASLAEATGIPKRDINAVMTVLAQRLDRGIRLQVHDGQAQLVTAPENEEAVHHFLGTTRPSPLSRPALEALATIAYRQPVTRAEVQAARGVNSDRAIQTLLARGLVEECGQRGSPGRPTQYVTTFGFLEYFGLSSLDDLPAFTGEAPEIANPIQLGLRTLNGNENRGDQAPA
jgi:segregation and condensation protein B